MKTPEEQNEKLTRWLDGAMNGAERAAFETEMAENTTLRAEADDMRQLGGFLRSHVTTDKAMPHADFFNSQIQERIAELHRSGERAQSQSRGGASWLSWLRAPWAIAGAAAMVALGFFLSNFKDERPQTVVLGLYTPNPSVHASSYHSSEADATVLMLDGLDPIPENKEITAVNVDHSETDPLMAATTLYDSDGKILLVMALDSRNQPLFLGKGSIQ